jgi:hypothetical protein
MFPTSYKLLPSNFVTANHHAVIARPTPDLARGGPGDPVAAFRVCEVVR